MSQECYKFIGLFLYSFNPIELIKRRVIVKKHGFYAVKLDYDFSEKKKHDAAEAA